MADNGVDVEHSVSRKLGVSFIKIEVVLNEVWNLSQRNDVNVESGGKSDI